MDVDADMVRDLASSSLLESLHHHSTTRHENNSAKSFKEEGLSCPVDLTMVDIGLAKPHPVLKISDMLESFGKHGKLQLLWGGKAAERQDILARFWSRWKVHQRSHEVFREHASRLHDVLPLQLHADEGQTLKQTGIMVISWQSPIGAGVATQRGSVDMGLNYLGSSYRTRYLISVLLRKVYAKKVKTSLDDLMAVVADELKQLFYEGIELNVAGRTVKLYCAMVGLKGDWPIHHKLGHVTRHFACKLTQKSKGICHLCLAGRRGVDLADYSENAHWKSTYLTDPPFETLGPLARIPQSSHLELMFRFDPFHTFLKGCFAELAGSALESR